MAFGEALGLIKSALDEHSSKAAYLHGSFGSGKSHFMAVLHALLDGHPGALDRADLAEVTTRHPWLGAKRFLLVPYHLTGSESLEAAILGGYVEHIRRHEPGRKIPQVYRAQGLLDDARRLREKLGDERFLAGFPTRTTPVSDLGQAMTPRSWTRVRRPDQQPASDDLITKVIEAYFPNYVDSVRGSASAFSRSTRACPRSAGTPGTRLRRHRAVPGRAGAVAGGQDRRPGVHQPGDGEGREAGRGGRRTGPRRSSASSRGSATCGTGHRGGAHRGGAPVVPRPAQPLGRPHRAHHARRPQPAADRPGARPQAPTGQEEQMHQAFQRTFALPGSVRTS
ncbi:hypothetical protein K7G98_16980 [Saccharothrix sp. MB29]|nr:hypothetical protein [Saccharothrix sp. MB29]